MEGDMKRSKEWLVPLTGVGFFVVGAVSFIVGGEPKSADDHSPRQIVDFYVSNKDRVEIGAIIGIFAALLLIYFGAYMRRVMRAAAEEDEILSLVAFGGLLVVATAFAIDGTILIGLAETADKIDPTAAQALQTLWDSDFLPILLGVLAWMSATGIAAVRTGVLPKWLGWLMIVLVVVAVTPAGFATAIAAAVLVPVISIWMALRARRSLPPSEPSLDREPEPVGSAVVR
jgi:hypothetical protein